MNTDENYKFMLDFEKWDVECLISILRDIRNYGYKECKIEVGYDDEEKKKMITILALNDYEEIDFGTIKEGDNQVYN